MQDITNKINSMMRFLNSGERGFFLDENRYVIYNKLTCHWSNDLGQRIHDEALINNSNERLFSDLKSDVRRKLLNDVVNDTARKLNMPWCIDELW